MRSGVPADAWTALFDFGQTIDPLIVDASPEATLGCDELAEPCCVEEIVLEPNGSCAMSSVIARGGDVCYVSHASADDSVSDGDAASDAGEDPDDAVEGDMKSVVEPHIPGSVQIYNKMEVNMDRIVPNALRITCVQFVTVDGVETECRLCIFFKYPFPSTGIQLSPE